MVGVVLRVRRMRGDPGSRTKCPVLLRKVRRVAVPGGPTILHGTGEHMTVIVEVTYEFAVFFTSSLSAPTEYCSNQILFEVRRWYPAGFVLQRGVVRWRDRVPGDLRAHDGVALKLTLRELGTHRIWQSCPLSAPGCLVAC